MTTENRKTILVADDRANLLTLLRMLLESEGWTVVVTQEGKKVLPMMRENPPDLLILDLKFGDADGVDILKQLRRQKSPVPVIVYTAAVLEAETANDLIANNPRHFLNVSVLQKPFDLDTLLERVQQVLGTDNSL